ncbi:MAG: hypothetical protein K1X55_12825 [Chitinophagales bacterium]|nr:hypothetical protein [Chitinophagales bacterium]
MSPQVRNILALVAGLLIGVMINMGIVILGSSIIPPPEGANVTTTEGLQASMHFFKPINFLAPFLAHAIGTLAGAFITARISTDRKIVYALAIGVFFLAGGASMVFQLPAPLWFESIDLILAYLPMAYIGGKLGMIKK